MILLPVGIDISKDTLDVCVHFDGQAHQLGQFANCPDGFAQLSEQLQQPQDLAGADQIHLVCEPTGGYQTALVAFAYEQGWLVSLPNPARVRDWAKGIGIRAKSDQQDAYVLARFAAECQPTPQGQLPAEIAELDSLLRRRDELEEMVCQELNRQKIYELRPDIPKGCFAYQMQLRLMYSCCFQDCNRH